MLPGSSDSILSQPGPPDHTILFILTDPQLQIQVLQRVQRPQMLEPGLAAQIFSALEINSQARDSFS